MAPSGRHSRSRSPYESRRKRDDRDRDRDRERGPDRDRERSRRDDRRRRSRSASPRRRSRSPQRRPRSRERYHERDANREPYRERDQHHRSRRSRSRSFSSSSSDSSHERKKRKRDKDKHRDKETSRERRERKEEKRARKERKREKKEKKKKGASSTAQWGKYGIISETDMYNKEQEFRTWLVEERKINPETTSKDQNKKEFARFVEDFNTATLPHEKYYNMAAYETRMDALRSGAFVPPADDSYDPNADLRAHTSKHKRAAAEQDTYLSKEQLEELRRVQHERIQAGKMKLMGMDVKQNMGVRMDGSVFE